MKGATRDEVPLDEFDQILDGSLLVPRSGSAGLWMKCELHGQFLVRRIPDRLVLRVSTQHRCFHIVRHHYPGYATNGGKTGNQAA
jgi:hypothetical protein